MNTVPPQLSSVRDTVKSWEFMRLIYNAVLLVPGIFIAWRVASGGFGVIGLATWWGDLLLQCVAFGATANVFYCLGPYAEVVIVALGFPLTGTRLRYILFGWGSLVRWP